MSNKRLIIIGQAPPAKSSRVPFGRTRLYKWFEAADIGCPDLVFTALVEKFPGKKNGSHMVPSPSEIKKNQDRLVAFIQNHLPGVIVPVGKLAAQTILNNSSTLEALIGRRFICNPFGAFEKELTIIALPHPSGANPWIYLHKRNHALLENSLSLLNNELRK